MDALEKFKYWESKAAYDLETARAMQQTGRYTYVVFMAQQAIEKIVKGLHVLFLEREPARTHNIALTGAAYATSNSGEMADGRVCFVKYIEN